MRQTQRPERLSICSRRNHFQFRAFLTLSERFLSCFILNLTGYRQPDVQSLHHIAIVHSTNHNKATWATSNECNSSTTLKSDQLVARWHPVSAMLSAARFENWSFAPSGSHSFRIHTQFFAAVSGKITSPGVLAYAAFRWCQLWGRSSCRCPSMLKSILISFNGCWPVLVGKCWWVDGCVWWLSFKFQRQFLPCPLGRSFSAWSAWPHKRRSAFESQSAYSLDSGMFVLRFKLGRQRLQSCTLPFWWLHPASLLFFMNHRRKWKHAQTSTLPSSVQVHWILPCLNSFLQQQTANPALSTAESLYCFSVQWPILFSAERSPIWPEQRATQSIICGWLL